MLILKHSWAILAVLIIWISPSIFAQKNSTIRVAVAASLLPPMDEIKSVFEAINPQIKIELIGASSGKLAAQIQNGAPFHLFLSADTEYPKQLADGGFAEGAPVEWGSGSLVVWSKQEIGTSVDDFLKSEKVKRIAIAQPELAPYGAAAYQWLQQKKLLTEIGKKMIYVESIGKVNQHIYSGTVDIAFTSLSSKVSKELDAKGKWIVLKDVAPIKHGAVLLRYGKSEEKAAVSVLWKFIREDAASRKIWEKFGYSIPYASKKG
jgi:molybdate transport system substrate-binding protein